MIRRPQELGTTPTKLRRRDRGSLWRRLERGSALPRTPPRLGAQPVRSRAPVWKTGKTDAVMERRGVGIREEEIHGGTFPPELARHFPGRGDE
jgi:hypothetical protein